MSSVPSFTMSLHQCLLMKPKLMQDSWTHDRIIHKSPFIYPCYKVSSFRFTLKQLALSRTLSILLLFNPNDPQCGFNLLLIFVFMTNQLFHINPRHLNWTKQYYALCWQQWCIGSFTFAYFILSNNRKCQGSHVGRHLHCLKHREAELQSPALNQRNILSWRSW